MREPSSRRLFLTDGGPKYQVLTITQEADASFYVSCPQFERSRWVEIIDVPGGGRAVSVSTAPGEGKLSVHATGFSGIRAHDGVRHKITVRGNVLADATLKNLQPRHLVSFFPERPRHVPVGERKSDYVLTARLIRPMAFVLFAVPTISGMKVSLNIAMHIDDIGEPPDMAFGAMGFPVHAVIWLAYTTKSMHAHPAHSVFCHHDGYTVPLFMGGDDHKSRLIAAMPTYTYENNVLGIKLEAIDQP